MIQLAKSKKPLAVTRAKKISANGEVTYYYSLPKIAIWDIKGMVWLFKRLRSFNKENK